MRRAFRGVWRSLGHGKSTARNMTLLARWIGVAALWSGLAGTAAAQVGGYGGFGQAGRTMLNVGEPNRQSAGEFGLRPWAMVSGNYFTDQVPQPDGALRRTEGYGGFAGYGVAGGKAWYRTSLGMNLTGMYRPSIGTFKRTLNSHVLTLGVSHLTGPRTRVSAAASGGYSNGGMGFGGAGLGSGMMLPFGTGNIMQMGAVDFGNPNDNAFVDEEVFNIGTLFAGTTGGIVHQISERWSTGAGGSSFLARRRYSGLAQSDGKSAYALAAYNIDRTSLLGVQYAHSWFSFRGLFGGNRAHMLNLFYQKSLGPKTMANFSAGAFRLRTTFIGAAPIDPAFAELMPGFQSFEVKEGSATGFMAAGTVARTFRNGMVGATYTRGLTPGNGLVLASRRDRATLTASTGLPGRFGLGGMISYGELRGLQQIGLRTQNLSIAGGVNRVLGAGFGFGLSGGYRTFKFNNGPAVKGQFASLGITWSPPGALLVF